MMSKNSLSRAATVGLMTCLGVVGGCATNAQTEDNASTTAQQALQAAQEAREMAQEALNTARQAQRAADDGQRCCQAQQQKLDRALERVQRK